MCVQINSVHPCVPRWEAPKVGGTGAGGRIPGLCLAVLTMALGEGSTGLEAIITVTSKTAGSVDTEAIGAEAVLGPAFVSI